METDIEKPPDFKVKVEQLGGMMFRMYVTVDDERTLSAKIQGHCPSDEQVLEFYNRREKDKWEIEV